MSVALKSKTQASYRRLVLDEAQVLALEHTVVQDRPATDAALGVDRDLQIDETLSIRPQEKDAAWLSPAHPHTRTGGEALL